MSLKPLGSSFIGMAHKDVAGSSMPSMNMGKTVHGHIELARCIPSVWRMAFQVIVRARYHVRKVYTTQLSETFLENHEALSYNAPAFPPLIVGVPMMESRGQEG